MSETIGILNYLAFFTLYIICFIFIYKKNTEYIGFTVLLIVNIAALLYATSGLMDIYQRSKYFVELIASFSIIVGLVFHTVIIIFILIVANNLNSKNIKKYGTPFNLPDKYKKKLELVKRLMIASFCLGVIILFIIFNYNSNLKNNFSLIFFTLAASLALIGISVYQIFEGDSFSKLSRQNLMYKPK
jgi:hypothetical protein